jgi:hypothetical protein
VSMCVCVCVFIFDHPLDSSTRCYCPGQWFLSARCVSGVLFFS